MAGSMKEVTDDVHGFGYDVTIKKWHSGHVTTCDVSRWCRENTVGRSYNRKTGANFMRQGQTGISSVVWFELAEDAALFLLRWG